MFEQVCDVSGFFASVCEGDPFVLFFWRVEWGVSFGGMMCVRGNQEDGWFFFISEVESVYYTVCIEALYKTHYISPLNG